jgi:hypothetical protein
MKNYREKLGGIEKFTKNETWKFLKKYTYPLLVSY